MRWNTVCFDLDNTLFSHEEAFERAIQYTFQSLYKNRRNKGKIPDVDVKDWFQTFKTNCDYYWDDFENNKLTREEYRKIRFDETMKAFGLPFQEGDAKQFHDQYEAVVARFSLPFNGLHHLLSCLRQAGIRLGIITNGKKETQTEKLKQLDVEKYIPLSHLIVSEEAGVEKPNKEIFDQALHKINGERKYALFIGDSWDLDVKGAIHAGWEAVFLNTRKEHKTSSETPAAECYSFQETSDFLLESLHLKG
ncbi:HAD family hydrolase [Salibacterium aidingense]|uniref:HAD family hydrolase n=1 Tax=Salibacterium aidingense TaxID=384933 RepID=UPI00040A6574|nr:HAD-IA family hydrolase [Salibacterium aidingense]